MRNKKVIFVGSNPSNSSPDHSAFSTETQSGKILNKWIEEAEISKAVSVNVSDEKTIENKPLTTKQIKDLSYDLESKIRFNMDRDTKVVALGKAAAKALSYTKLKFLELPHPSGLNRKLNDKDFVSGEIEKLKKYVKE